MKVLIASDHAGFGLKQFLIENLASDHQVEDLGPSNLSSVDYPDFAEKLCKKIQKGEAEKGILICGTGIGMSITANKFPGVYAAHSESLFTAELAAEHNLANVLCLGARVTGTNHALAIAKVWLSTKFGGERHQKRIDKIKKIESC